MKILINCVNLLSGSKGAGGAGKYVEALVTELAKMATVRLLISPSNFLHFQKISGLQVVPLLASDTQTIHQQLTWSDIYFCPLNELVPACIDSRVPVVAGILDLQHEVYPHFFKQGIYQQRRKYYGYAIARSNAVITISENEKLIIQKIYHQPEVYVTPLAGYLGEEVSHHSANLQLPDPPYLIYPAIPWRHKNHYRLLEALAILKREYTDFENLKLILTGAQEHQLKASTVEKVIGDLNLKDVVEIKGFVSDLELSLLIKNAQLMAFPSLYEGFGIPLVDAMNLGTPAIAASLAAIPEICADAIAYFQDPLDSRAIASDLAKLLGDREQLIKLAVAGKIQAAKYSAQKTAELTLNVFEKVVANHQNRQPLQLANAKLAPSNFGKTPKRLTLIIDALSPQLEKKEKLELLENLIGKISQSTWDFVKVVNLIPFSYQFKMLDEESDRLNLYSDYQYSPHYFNAWNYLIDTVIDTDYLMYLDCQPDLHLENLDLASAIASLDFQEHLGAVAFTDTVNCPLEISPLGSVELIQQYNFWKTKKLEFFHLKIVRTSIQDQNTHIATYKFLSLFLANQAYIKYPLRQVI